MASIRLRAGALWQYVRSTGDALTVGDRIDPKADACVIGKIGAHDIYSRQRAWLGQLQAFKGLKILDYTDDHLHHPSMMTGFYEACLPLVHGVVCASRVLQAAVRERFAGPVDVIEDALDVPFLHPRASCHNPLRLLWFGHPSNVNGLLEFLPDIRFEKPLELIVVTSEPGIRLLQSSGLRLNTPLRVLAKPWSPEALVRSAQDSDVCIIPVEQKTTRKAGVSANRLLSALALGLPVAADPIDSYVAQGPCFASLRSPAFPELLRDPAAWHARVIAQQARLQSDYSLTALGRQWLACVDRRCHDA